MSSRRAREEERVEKIIRGLLKLPDNRRCINCNSLGPQYVCTTFWTFVCTSCSGVHREFTHRVKSVSMAKFKAEEVSSLQAAGNERAKQLYFKTWDPQRNSYPETGNLHRLREFIKNVYVDRKYSGGRDSDRDSDKLAMVKVEPKDERRAIEKSGRWAKQEELERRSIEQSFASGKIELRNFIEERRSPRVQEIEKSGSARRSRSTARFEIVDDRFKDDSYGSGRRSRLASGSLSPDSQKSRETSGLPQGVRPLKEIMGSSFPPIKAPDTPKANERRESDGAANAKKTAPTSTQGSADGKVAEQKTVSLSSLIDFTEPDSPQPQNQLALTTIDTGNSSSQSQAPPSNMNSVESLLFELSSPVAAPQASATKPADSTNTAFEDALALVPISTGDDVGNTTDGQLALTVHPHQQTVQQHQQLWPSPAPNGQTPYTNAPPQQFSQQVPRPAQETGSETGSQTAGRKELPADIFALSYSAYQAPVPNNWQYHQTPGMGYGMQQYQHPAAVAQQQPGYPNTGRSTNPFDLGDDTPPQTQHPSFPSMMPMQGALPQVSNAHMGLQHQSSPYAHSQSPFQPSSYGMNMPQGAYMGQQHPNNMLVSRPQGNNNAAFASFNPVQQPNNNPQCNRGFGSGGDQAAFASLNPLQLSGGRSQPPGAAPNSYSNPFG